MTERAYHGRYYHTIVRLCPTNQPAKQAVVEEGPWLGGFRAAERNLYRDATETGWRFHVASRPPARTGPYR